MVYYSIILPYYNRKQFLIRAVRSVWNQTYLRRPESKKGELILVDDGSCKEEKINHSELLPTIPDPILEKLDVYLLTTEHKGVSHARNIGVEKSKGEWLFFLDSDDEWHPRKLEKQLDFIHSHPEYAIHQTREVWIRNGKFTNPCNKHIKKSGNLFQVSLESCQITFSSVCLHRKVWEEHGGLDENLPACEDYDLWVSVTQTKQVGLLDSYLLTRYGGHGDQLSHTYPAMDRFRIYSLLKRSKELSRENQSLAQKILLKKINILIQGREKRKKDSKVLHEIATWVEKDYGKLLPEKWIDWKNYLLNNCDWRS